MSTTTSNLGLFKYNTSTDGNVAFSIDQALNNNWDIIDTNWNQGSNRNIGEIIASTIPLIDAGLHLLDGSLISGSGIYSEFVTYIASLVSTYPDLFTTEFNWQSAVTTYGVCGKFVYNSVNNTVRLPRITGFTEGTIDPTTLGDLTEAGLPNVTDETGGAFYNNSASDTTATNPIGQYVSTTYKLAGSTSNMTASKIVLNLSKGNSIYGNSNTVQPQSIKVLYYIIVATTTKTSIEVDIDEIATDLNGKADVDLTNTIGSWSNVTKSSITKLAFELDFDNAIQVSTTCTETTQTYTCTEDGVFSVFAYGSGSNGVRAYIHADATSGQNTHQNILANGSHTKNIQLRSGIPVLKGQTVNYVIYAIGSPSVSADFIPLKKS